MTDYDGSKIVTIDEFPYDFITDAPKQVAPRGNPGTKNRPHYKKIISAFDIETSRLPDIEQAIMYIWMWQFDTEYTVIGRTWDEFLLFKKRLIAVLGEYTLVVYVHNLSYEFQFLRGIYEFEPKEVFAVDKRKVLKCTMNDQHIEFRCSYLHTNMNLDTYTSKMNVKHQKLVGYLDYDYIRYSWTKLTDEEIKYCINDVLGLVEALKTEMDHDGDTLYTIPLTSTGYVRRDALKAMRHVNHFFVQEQLPDYDLYLMLNEAFRGGNTHANRYYTGKILKDVGSADRSSAYPYEVCNSKLPVSAFYTAGSMTYDDIIRQMVVRGKALVMRVKISGIRLSYKFWGCPYLPLAKCRNILNPICDNGRIITADYLETTITDIDFKIIIDEYEWDDIEFINVAHASYGKLPRPLINTTIRYFKYKTELKNIEGQEILYFKSKNKLNSIYGMMAQRPVIESLQFRLPTEEELMAGEENVKNFRKAVDFNPIFALEKHNKRAFLCYQWGVWITAWARYHLEEAIRLAGDNFVYCDTDSVKYHGDVDFSTINEEAYKESMASGSQATDKSGITYYMGVFEDEGRYDEFKTLGAKKYCYVKDKKLYITVAGVGKTKGADELGTIENFKEGFTWYRGGGTESLYNDDPEVKQIEVDGHTINITSNVVIRPSTYTLGITAEYQRLLEDSLTEWEPII